MSESPTRTSNLGDVFVSPQILEDIKNWPEAEVEAEAEEVQPELNVVHQACLGCVFAQREGKNQTGCSLGRLEKFKAIDPNLVIEGYNEHGDFFIVNRACNTFRDELWGDRHRNEDMKALALKESQIRTDVLLYIDEDFAEFYNNHRATSGDVHFKVSLGSLLSQTQKPNKVIVISNQTSIPRSEIISLLRKYGGDLNWQMTAILERTNEKDFVSVERAIDISFNRIEGQFYLFLPIGDSVNANLISNINVAINDRLERFSVLYDQDDYNEKTGSFHNYVVSKNLHDVMGGNRQIEATNDDGEHIVLNNLIQKAVHLAKSSNSEHMIQDIYSVGGGA